MSLIAKSSSSYIPASISSLSSFALTPLTAMLAFLFVGVKRIGCRIFDVPAGSSSAASADVRFRPLSAFGMFPLAPPRLDSCPSAAIARIEDYKKTTVSQRFVER